MDKKKGQFLKVMAMLSPLFVLYVLAILVFSSDTFKGDESGYVDLARNLSRGYYSLGDKVEFYWGPGYPLVLLPFLWLDLPWLAAKLLNAVFLFGAAIYSYYTIRLYAEHRAALAFSYLIGLYPPHIREIHLLLTEPIAFFLVSGFAYHFCRLFRSGKSGWASFLPASLFLGYLALTKIIFGYVIVIGLAASGLVYILALAFSRRGRVFAAATWGQIAGKALVVCSIAILLCLPYLTVTYSLTGRVFYWSNSGGMQLYWMSTPFKGELGDWFNPKEVANDPQVASNHLEFVSRIEDMGSIEQDDAFRAQAIQNIVSHPAKFLQNWVANVGRLLFSYPYSYTSQKLSTFFYLIPNMFVVVLAALLVYPSFRGRRLIPFEVFALLIFGLVTLFGNSLMSAYARQFQILVPAFAVWMGFMITNVVRVEIRR